MAGSGQTTRRSRGSDSVIGMSAGVPTIVVVDDAPDVRRLMRTRLRISGMFEVVGEGADGHEAIELAGLHKPLLMLLDVSMPGLDGLEALPRIREVSPGTRVVLFTGFDEEGLVERAKALGAADFLTKSMPIESVIDRLLQLAGGAPAARRQPETDDVQSSADVRVLNEHLERFREVFDEAAIGMATMTLTGRLVRVNRALASLLRLQESDLVGRAVRQPRRRLRRPRRQHTRKDSCGAGRRRAARARHLG